MTDKKNERLHRDATVGRELVTEALAVAERILRGTGLSTVGAHGDNPPSSQRLSELAASWRNRLDIDDEILRAEMVIPLRLNDGTPLDVRDLARVYVELAQAFGGMTVWACHGLAVGARAELDESTWIVTLLPKRLLDRMAQLARSFEKRFGQREIFWFTSPASRHVPVVGKDQNNAGEAAE
jgi:hypothetical protein